MVRGSPRMCTATQPAPVAAATSQSAADTSLSRDAPAATAASATSGLTVSTDSRTPRSRAGEARAATTGTTRASSTSVSTGWAPGRDDSDDPDPATPPSVTPDELHRLGARGHVGAEEAPYRRGDGERARLLHP